MKKPYVAIVDDDASFAAYLRTFLSQRGYEARCYTRGDEVLASACSQGVTPGSPGDHALGPQSGINDR